MKGGLDRLSEPHINSKALIHNTLSACIQN